MQPISYDFLEIRTRINQLISHFGYSGDSRLKAEAGISGNVSEYFEPIDNPRRKVKTLAEKLHQRLGANPDWVLFGRGPMLVQDIRGRDEDSIRYEQIGRAVCNLVEMLGPEIKKSLGTLPDEDEMLAGLMSKVNAIKVPGPAPDLTEDEIEELSRRQGGHKTGCDEE